MLAILFVSFLSLLSPVQAAVFEFDPAFGVNGISDLPSAVEDSYDTPYTLIQLSDQKYLLSGSSSSSENAPVLWRVTESGDLDTTFNSQGWRTYVFTGGGVFFDVTVASDNSYLTCGQVSGGHSGDILIAKVSPDSSLDTSFNSTGYVVLDGVNYNDSCERIIEDSNGKYVGAGKISDGDGAYRLAVFRYNPDGTLDTSFSDDGIFIIDNGGTITNTWANSIVEVDGQYLVTGALYNSSNGSEAITIRLNNNGSLDSAFGISGVVTFSLDSNQSGTMGHDLKVEANGDIVIVGDSSDADGATNMLVFKLKSDGDLDTSFAGSGYFIYDEDLGVNDESYENAMKLTIDEGGNYVISGISPSANYQNLLTLWRITSAGELDTSFNDTGYYKFESEFYSQNYFNKVIVESDGQYTVNLMKFNETFDLSTVSLLRFNNEYQVTNLPAGYEVEFEEINIEEGSSNGTYGNVLLRLLRAGVPLAEMQVDMTEDQDWSAVSGDTDSTSFKSFVHNILNVGGAGANYSLFVPKAAAHTAVGICPGATALSQLELNCSGLQSLTSSSSNVTVVNVDGQDYWRVSGLTGTGGFSFTAAAGGALPATGTNQTLLMVVASGLMLLAVVVFKRAQQIQTSVQYYN